MSKNTVYHHITVNILYFYTLTNGMNVDSFSRLIMVYGVFSTLAFPVNAYLATRVITKNQILLKTFSSVAFLNYLACCALNWSYQIYHLVWKDHFLTQYGTFPILIYGAIIYVVMMDDIILMRYLRDNSYFEWLKPEVPAVIEKTILVFRTPKGKGDKTVKDVAMTDTTINEEDTTNKTDTVVKDEDTTNRTDKTATAVEEVVTTDKKKV